MIGKDSFRPQSGIMERLKRYFRRRGTQPPYTLKNRA